MMKVALVQMTSGDDPAENLSLVLAAVRSGAQSGAEFVLTPEVTNMISDSRSHQQTHLNYEQDDPMLQALRSEAKALGIWILLGSLALKIDDEDRFANRSILISPKGEIAARYDKIHMFDVEIDAHESYRESAAYRPGDRAVVADTAFGSIGMTICYDVRFPHLHRKLAKAGAGIITAPAAFSPVTGAAHWESLLRARAIETGCFVLAPAQCGQNTTKRRTHGHSLVISPWGEVLADAGVEPCVTLVDLDLAEIDKARRRVPSLSHDREFEGP